MKICYDCSFGPILINSDDIIMNLQIRFRSFSFFKTVKKKKSSLFPEDLNYFKRLFGNIGEKSFSILFKRLIYSNTSTLSVWFKKFLR